MLPTVHLPAQNVLPVCAKVYGQLRGALAVSRLDSAKPPFLFSLNGHHLLPALTLLAVLAPGFRSRRQAPPSLEALRPEAAKALLRLRRDANSSFSMSTAGASSLALEDGVEGHLLVHFTSSRGNLTIAGGWLGAGRRRYAWLPLRPTLTWNSPDGPGVTSAEIAEIAADLHAGLEQLKRPARRRRVLRACPDPSRRTPYRARLLCRVHGRAWLAGHLR